MVCDEWLYRTSRLDLSPWLHFPRTVSGALPSLTCHLGEWVVWVNCSATRYPTRHIQLKGISHTHKTHTLKRANKVENKQNKLECIWKRNHFELGHWLERFKNCFYSNSLSCSFYYFGEMVNFPCWHLLVISVKYHIQTKKLILKSIETRPSAISKSQEILCFWFKKKKK